MQLDGAALPQEAAADLISATVQEDVDHASSFSIVLGNWDLAKMDMKWSDEDLFALGKQVEVQMGPVGKLETLISGEITGFELVVSSKQPPRFIVRGYDRTHRLTRGRHTMSYTNLADSDIATQVAGKYGLSAEVESTSEIYKYVLQHNQTDASFLRDRARRIGFEMFVRERKLIFRARKNDGQSDVVLSQETGLLEFYPLLSSMQQAAKVEMRSWNPTEKSTWVGRASSDDESAKMGGDTIGLAAANDAFGDACVSSAVHPSASQADADQRAKGRLKAIALGYITADGSSLGRTDLRAGTVVKVQGMGKRFSGFYYLMTTTHTCTHTTGYLTSFEARRNAV
ncbi:MAG TPA: contractile injection system protein, VgrG/Pvc8 family [Bryocella sp.]|nr:contractile injection system protein, VgrG/Pvc8 family [Bryocella sp.]